MKGLRPVAVQVAHCLAIGDAADGGATGRRCGIGIAVRQVEGPGLGGGVIAQAGDRDAGLFRPGPVQRRLAGRRWHGRALSHAVPASPAVAARTMLLSCPASRRAGPGALPGRSRKCFRPETSMSEDCTGSRRQRRRRCQLAARPACGPVDIKDVGCRRPRRSRCRESRS